MSRWPVRMLGILILIAFVFLMAHLYRQLVQMQKMQRTQKPAATSTCIPRPVARAEAA